VRLDAYLRSQLSKRWALDFGTTYRDVESIWDETTFSLDTRFAVTEWMSLQLGAEAGDEIVLYRAGVRFNFGL